MAKAVDHVRTEFGAVRTGRATPALVETLMVDYYGQQTPLRQLAGFSVPDAMLLVVTPYDKGSLGAIEKAIQVVRPRDQPDQRRRRDPARLPAS